MKLPILLCLIAGLSFLGCKKDTGPAAREVKPLEKLDPNAAPTPPAEPAAPQPEAPATPTEGGGAATGETGFGAETLNAALSEHLDNGNPMIGSLDDFVRLKLVRRMPQPPAGKKFVLDPKKKKVVVVNQ
jgi:hypothetical protein